MTKTTNYRTKLRAVFLAAIMVISVVGMSVAFSGAAAASTNTQPNFEPRDNPYQGQTIFANSSEIDVGSEYDLRVVDSFDDGNVSSSSSVEDLIAQAGGEEPDGIDLNDEPFVEIETDDLEPGQYFLDGPGFEDRSNVRESDTFEVREQRLDAAFDDDTVTDSGTDSNVELDIESNRGSYDVNVSADGDLDEDELIDIFINNDTLAELHKTDQVRNNVTFSAGVDGRVNISDGFGDALVNETRNLVLDADDDTFNESVSDLLNATSVFNDVSADEIGDDVTNIVLDGTFDAEQFLEDFEDENPFQAFAFNQSEDDEDEQIVLFNIRDTEADVDFTDIDAGDYTFDFDVVDTEATSSTDITVNEQDSDGSFDQGTYQAGAGDLAHFEFELENTDEAWIQIGDEDSDFVDVVYIEIDDDDEPVDIVVNTRLLGAPGVDDPEEVYDVENTDRFESATHGSLTNSALPSNGVLFEDDGEFNIGSLTGGASDAQKQFALYIEELSLIDDAQEYLDGEEIQLTRPLQATDYELQLAGNDISSTEGVFDADAGAGEANDQLDSAVLELTEATIGNLRTWTAPEEAADDETDIEELLDVVTEREEIALDDRLVIQVEATGLYGGMIAGGNDHDVDFDRLEDGVSTNIVSDFFDDEEITFEIEADARTGNQDPLEVRLDENSDDSDTFIVIGPDQDQFFLIVDTSSDDAFANGDAPDDGEGFTAVFEYDADNEDDRFEFGDEPFVAGDSDAENYPYLRQGETLSGSVEFELVPREVTFNNLNADDEIQAENIDDSEISGVTNIAPGSDAELRVASTDASTSFRIGERVEINGDGEFSATFDFSNQEVGDEFDTRFRAEGSGVDTVDSVIVEEGELGVEEPVEDDEDDVADDEDDVVDDDDDVVDDEADDADDTDDEVEDVDDETPGFGVLVALLAIIGAALLATRRQN